MFGVPWEAEEDGATAMTLDEATEEVSIHMDEILHCFNPGAKITVLVRRPDRPDGSQDFCLSNDDLSDAVAALMIRAKKENRL